MPEENSEQMKQSIESADISFAQAMDILIGELQKWFQSAVENIPNLILALAVLTVTYLLGKVAYKAGFNIFHRAFESEALAGLFSTIVKMLVIAVGFFFALDLIGLQKAVVSLLAGAGIIGLAIGFAFQDMAENFLAGMMLAIRKPFKVGDLIESNSHMGTVIRMNLRNTIIKDFDGQIIYTPNKDVFKKPLENFSQSGKRRITIKVGVSYGEELDHVEGVLRSCIEELDFLAQDKTVDVWALEYGDSSINFTVRYWIDFPEGDTGYLEAIHLGVKTIKKALDQEDILIPFPIRTLDFGIKGGQNLPSPLKEGLSGMAHT